MNQHLNSQKSQNPKSPVPKTMQMNDRDFTNDLLATEKYLTTSYVMALHEGSHGALYEDILTVFNETRNSQRDLYNLMFKKGWSSFEAADPQKLQQSYQQFKGYASQFPYGNQIE
jgi:spore coat protein CotF